MRPVHPLHAGEARAVGGVAAAFGPSKQQPDAPHRAASDAVASLSVPRGLTPFASLQLGLGNGYEGDVGYDGRSLRAGGRKGWSKRSWAATVGAGASTLVSPHEREEPALAGAHGFGVDVPAVVGWQSEGGLYAVWLGARGGYDRANASGLFDPTALRLNDLTASRFYAGGVLGLMAGSPPFNVGLEIGFTHHWVAADVGDTHFSQRIVTWTPAAALLIRL